MLREATGFPDYIQSLDDTRSAEAWRPAAGDLESVPLGVHGRGPLWAVLAQVLEGDVFSPLLSGRHEFFRPVAVVKIRAAISRDVFKGLSQGRLLEEIALCVQGLRTWVLEEDRAATFVLEELLAVLLTESGKSGVERKAAFGEKDGGLEESRKGKAPEAAMGCLHSRD